MTRDMTILGENIIKSVWLLQCHSCKVGPIAVRLHLLLETKYNTAALQQSDNFYLTFKTLTQAQASERWRSKDIQTRK